MAVPEQTPYKEYTANGSTTSFALGFICDSKNDLIVLVDNVAPPIATWNLVGGNAVFTTAPASGKKIILQRQTKFERSTNFQGNNNSFRPETINKDIDRVWMKLQELGVADMLLKIYVDRLHGEQKDYIDNKDQLVRNIISDLRNYVNQQDNGLANSINSLRTHVDQQDNNRNSYFENLINQQGVSLQQLDNYYKHLLQGIANIAAEKGWLASLVTDKSGKNQQEINDHFDSKLKREMVSVWDFFTKSEAQAYNYAIINGASASFDSHRPLKEFFDYIAANNVGTAYCNGIFYTSSGLLLGGASGSKTKQVMGDFTIHAIAGNVIHTLFGIQAGQNFSWRGTIVTGGTGGLIYANRTVRRGLVIGGQYASTHTYISAHQSLNGFIEYGFLMDNNTTGSCVDSLRGTRCGSGLFKAGNSGARNWSLYSNFTVYSENTASGYTQNTVLQVATLPPEGLVYMPMVEIDGGLYNVQSIDYANSRLTLFPVLDRNNVATELRYYFGASVATAGSDASTTRLNKINSSDNAIGYHSGALYPATVGTLTVEANGIDVIIGGNSISQAHVGGIIEAWHYESADYSLVRRTYAPLSFVVGSTNYEFALAKVYDLTRPRNPTSNALTGGYGMQGITFAWGGEILKYENPRESGNNTAAIDVTDINRSEYWHYGNTKDFSIAAPNANLNRLFGFNRKQVVVVGSGNNGNPTSVTFNAPTGYTVNGQASVTLTGFTQAAKFDVYLQFSRNNFVVACSTLPPSSVLSASVTYDPPPLAPDQIEYWNVTLTGAKLGDMVACSFNKPLNGTRLWAEVTGANIVTVYHQNPTTNPVDLTSGALSVKLV